MQQIATDTLIKIYRRTSSAHGNGPHAHCGHIKKSHILDETIYLRPIIKKGSNRTQGTFIQGWIKGQKKKKGLSNLSNEENATRILTQARWLML